MLKESEAGRKTTDIIREYGISEKTFYTWKRKYGGLEASDIKRLKTLEAENRRLKQIVADLTLDNSALKDVLGKKVVPPTAKRKVGHYLEKAYKFSQRRVCKLLNLGRSSYQYQSRRDDSALRDRLKALADQRPRFGYRRLHALLKREGQQINHKRVFRLYREGDLGLPRRRRKRLVAGKRVPHETPAGVNDRWSIDFIHDQLATGTRFRILSVVDDFSRECLACEADLSLPGERVVRVLDLRGKPSSITLDNGPEFKGRALDRWAYGHGVTLAFIRPGKPLENAFVESFHSRLRDECLNLHWFGGLPEARSIVEAWRVDYNHGRPHSSLGYLTPAEFASGSRLGLGV